MSLEPSLVRDGNTIILTAPEKLPREAVERTIQDLDVFFRKLNCQDCAVIMDFQKLSETEMDIGHMKKFIDLIVKYHVKNVVSIPPNANEGGKMQIIQLLDKSLPIFGKRGIWVLIVDSKEKAYQSINSIGEKGSDEERKQTRGIPIKIHIAGRFEEKSVNKDLVFEFQQTPKLNNVFGELNRELGTKIFTPESMEKEEFLVILNGSRIENNEIQALTLQKQDTVTIIQPLR